LIETLVAVSIFSLSILSLMAVLAQGISDTNYAKQRIIAAYLAQEGIEYVRNMRDTYVLFAGPQAQKVHG
jgi:Tfp pilus assembly protein PilV